MSEFTYWLVLRTFWAERVKKTLVSWWQWQKFCWCNASEILNNLQILKWNNHHLSLKISDNWTYHYFRLLSLIWSTDYCFLVKPEFTDQSRAGPRLISGQICHFLLYSIGIGHCFHHNCGILSWSRSTQIVGQLVFVRQNYTAGKKQPSLAITVVRSSLCCDKFRTFSFQRHFYDRTFVQVWRNWKWLVEKLCSQHQACYIFLSRLLAYNCGTCCRIGELSIWSRHGCLPTLNTKTIKVEILPYFHWYVTKWLFWIIMYSLNSCWCSKKGYSMKMVLLAVLTTLEATSKQVQECSVLTLHEMFQQMLSIMFSWERQV